MTAKQQSLLNVQSNLLGVAENIQSNLFGVAENIQSNLLSEIKKVENNTTQLLSKTSDYNIQQKLKNKTFSTITYPNGGSKTALGFKYALGKDPSGLISREFFEQNSIPTGALYGSYPEIALQYQPQQFDKGFTGNKDAISIITFNNDATKAILVGDLPKDITKNQYENINNIGLHIKLFDFDVTVNNGVITLLSNNPKDSTRGGPLDYPHFLTVLTGSQTNWKNPFTGGDLLWGDIGSAFSKDFKFQLNYDESSNQLTTIDAQINFYDKEATPQVTKTKITLSYNQTEYEIYPVINPDIQFGNDGVSEFVTDFSAKTGLDKFQIKSDFDSIYDIAKSRLLSPKDLPVPYPTATNGNYTQAYGNMQ